ncbi:MAG: hypothetical protein ACRDHV_05955 [Actinomycetota bacterium]
MTGFLFLVILAVVVGSLTERVLALRARWSRFLVPLFVIAVGVGASGLTWSQDPAVLAFAFAAGFASGWARTAATSVLRDKRT